MQEWSRTTGVSGSRTFLISPISKGRPAPTAYITQETDVGNTQSSLPLCLSPSRFLPFSKFCFLLCCAVVCHRGRSFYLMVENASALASLSNPRVGVVNADPLSNHNQVLPHLIKSNTFKCNVSQLKNARQPPATF